MCRFFLSSDKHEGVTDLSYRYGAVYLRRQYHQIKKEKEKQKTKQKQTNKPKKKTQTNKQKTNKKQNRKRNPHILDPILIPT